MPIEYKGVSQLAATLGRIPIELRAELRPAVLEAGRIIADQAKVNASYSTRIPGAIRVVARFSARGGGAVIRVNQSKAPEARVLEFGNKDGHSRATFRHPVYGHDTWVTQSTRPFLFPAVEQKKPEALAIIAAAIRTAMTLKG